MPIRSRFCSLIVALALVGAGPAFAAPGGGNPLENQARPRELSEAERAAVGMAVAYFQRGPEAWWERLASNAPLRRLGRPAALAEIAARVGPREGATWQLVTPGPSFDPQTAVFSLEFPSGLDETLILHLSNEGGWKIAELRTSIDPVSSVLPAAVSSTPPPPPAPAPEPAGSNGFKAAALALFTLALIALGGGIALLVLTKGGKRNLAAGSGLAAVLLAGAGVWLWSRDSGPSVPAASPAAPAAETAFLRLGALAPLRAALAAGTDRVEIERLLAAPLNGPGLRDVQALWGAQYRFLEGDLNAAGTLLDGFHSTADYPLADLLRARLGFRRFQREETGWAYRSAIRKGLDHDVLRLEAAAAEALTSQVDLAEGEFTDLLSMGSRLSEPWYGAAQIAAAQSRMEEAEGLLRQAWRLAPVPRSELFDDPVLAYLATRPGLFPMFQFENPEEPSPGLAPGDVRAPLALPPDVRAATCGRALRLTVGEAELLVPGGTPLAPAQAEVEDAESWRRHAEAKALAALPALTAGTGTLQPRLLRLAERAGRALAEQNRWDELIELTEPLVASIERAPAILIRLRAQALHKLEREADARQLLIRLAGTDLAQRRPTPGTLFELAELFAAAGEYDTAIQLSQKADSQLPEPRGARRRKQLEMDRNLTASYASYRSEHFEIRYPKTTGETYARGVAFVLEQERRRLGTWIPLRTGSKRIEVHLFPAVDFFESYSGDVAVLGIFDGKVRVPFADFRSLNPGLLAILSHELAHALITDATRDRAPHWLQEGLAEHVRMGRGRLNPFPDLARTGRVLSFPTIDPILRGFAEPQLVDLAYSEAAWTVHFLEARFGAGAIQRLLDAYGNGRTTGQALVEACGLTPAELDRALWQWGTTQAPQTRDLEVQRYDLEYMALVERERKQELASVVRLGMSEEAREETVRRQTQAEERRQRMATWHAAYAVRAQAIQRSLNPILKRYRDGAPVDAVPACIDLSANASQMLGEPGLLDSPDPYVNQTLRTAYKTLMDLGDACRSGRKNEVPFLIVEADRAAREAVRALAPYKLAP